MTSQLDCYVGRVDGYAYHSNDRLHRMRKKGTFKPVGPLTMYKYPGCTSMDYGWWRLDPALKDQTWYLSQTNYPQPVSEHTRFIDHQLKVYKVFRM
ncbi:sulfide:quinone oxidoreductase [Holotrichia oblita]|uniref:Sulfide:quinone oxidoreductase n=1 Tax=Holotrichia oblita TaxID=644536 RepID=A0ACB9TK05_HOLOL|nr:sulfide:quinone oxidoreductase [Holotrichia oblita]